MKTHQRLRERWGLTPDEVASRLTLLADEPVSGSRVRDFEAGFPIPSPIRSAYALLSMEYALRRAA